MKNEAELNSAQFVSAISRVLVFPCGSEIGLELQRSLGWCKHIELVGASSVTSNHGKYVYKRYFEGLPFVDEPGFLDAFNQLIVSEHIDFVYPAHDNVVLKLGQNEELLACSVIGSPVETCEICRSKSLTYKTFNGLLRVPRLYRSNERIEHFPVFLKPDVGQGSVGIHMVESQDEVSFFSSQDPTLLILECLSGQEFTVDCFTDRLGKLRFVGPRLRARVRNGISVETYPVDGEAFVNIAQTINKVLRLQGGWFFQVKETVDNDLAIMEIAPRIAGAMALTRDLGVNLPLLSVYDRLGLDVDIQTSRCFLKMDGALTHRFTGRPIYDHVYVGLDNTLVIDGHVNVVLVAFLYQCLNTGVRRHLITRHSGDVRSILQHYCLESLFDTVTQIKQNQQKADSMLATPAIFIDDSYGERRSVADKLNIPTFDLDAIESLMDAHL